MPSSAKIDSIYRYPVKGLTPEPLARVALTPGQTLPADRRYAIENGPSGFDPAAPKWMPKPHFLMLMRDEWLAGLRTHFDDASHVLTIRRNGEIAVRGNLEAAEGRAAVENFFATAFAGQIKGPPKVLSGERHSFSDVARKVVSIINLASVRAIENMVDYPVHPLRFRANLYVDTGRAWEEFDWVDQEIRLGDVTFRVDRRNGRCGATNVNPASGVRDMDIPGSLRASFGHKDLGVYLTVETSGKIAVDDRLTRPFAAERTLAPATKLNGSAGRRFICRGCYYIYSEDAGVPADGITPGTTYQQLPENFRCPDCGTDKGKLRPHVA